MVTVLLLALGYALGSIPTGMLIARWRRGMDIRQYGSGNIGMTNVLRAVGQGAAAATLLGDLAKGIVPVLLAGLWLTSPWATGFVGLAAIVGHMYPLFAGFHGGKGVATSLGVFLPLLPGPLRYGVRSPSDPWPPRPPSLLSPCSGAHLRPTSSVRWRPRR